MFLGVPLLFGSIACFFLGAFSFETKSDPLMNQDHDSTASQKMVLSWGLDLFPTESANLQLLFQIIVLQSTFLLIMFTAVIPAIFTLKKLWNGILGLGLGSVLFHCVAVLYGAPVFDDVIKTYLWSLLMSAFVFLPTFTICGPSSDSISFLVLFSSVDFEKPFILFAKIPALGAILGAWVGAFVLPLDWDRPWQKWPLPCTYGAMAGYLLGIACASLAIHLTPKKSIEKKD